jgi:hypothetical protein
VVSEGRQDAAVVHHVSVVLDRAEHTDDEVRTLHAPYAPRYDFQGISGEAELDAIRAAFPAWR